MDKMGMDTVLIMKLLVRKLSSSLGSVCNGVCLMSPCLTTGLVKWSLKNDDAAGWK